MLRVFLIWFEGFSVLKFSLNGSVEPIELKIREIVVSDGIREIVVSDGLLVQSYN